MLRSLIEKIFIHDILWNRIGTIEESPMKFTSELKTELTKALKLSSFITLIVISLIMIQYRIHGLNGNKRDLASAPRETSLEQKCSSDEGMRESGRSVPPFERKSCSH